MLKLIFSFIVNMIAKRIFGGTFDYVVRYPDKYVGRYTIASSTYAITATSKLSLYIKLMLLGFSRKEIYTIEKADEIKSKVMKGRNHE
jgi:hypothetical protein